MSGRISKTKREREAKDSVDAVVVWLTCYKTAATPRTDPRGLSSGWNRALPRALLRFRLVGVSRRAPTLSRDACDLRSPLSLSLSIFLLFSTGLFRTFRGQPRKIGSPVSLNRRPLIAAKLGARFDLWIVSCFPRMLRKQPLSSGFDVSTEKNKNLRILA